MVEGKDGVVVVGASIAGLRAVEALRTDGYAGPLTLIGAEVHLPYDRPPLSKKLLAGDWEPDRIALRKPDEYDHLGLDLHLGVAATSLDVQGRAVHLADGTTVLYGDGVIIATGTAPKRLPRQDAVSTVHELRTIEDSLALRARIADGAARVVVVGAGFIGLEVAATSRARGCAVTVLEGLAAPLIRGLGAEMGAAATAVHAADGIDIRCGVTVTGLSEDGVTLGSGELLPADVIVVGIGVAPVTGWLDGSGLELRDGVVCDATLAAAPGVWAVGDLCRWPNGLYGEEMRIEHWTNAAEQGAAAARNLMATVGGVAPTPYAPVPFFWSDQGRHRIQFLGRSATDPADEVVVAVGTTDQERWLALYRRGERLWGVLGTNAPRLVMLYRNLLADAVSWDDALAFAATQQS